jgi:hypothetical protein
VRNNASVIDLIYAAGRFLVALLAMLVVVLLITFALHVILSTARRLVLWIWRIADKRHRRGADERANEEVELMQKDLIRLDLSRPVQPYVRKAFLLRHSGNDGNLFGALLTALALLWLGPALQAAWNISVTIDRLPEETSSQLEDLRESLTTIPDFALGPAVAYVGASLVLAPLVVAGAFAIPFVAAYMAQTRRYAPEITDRTAGGRAYRYNIASKIGLAIHSCADAYETTSPYEDTKLLRIVPAQLIDVEKAILRAHRTRGLVPARSHRHKELKIHARKVVSRLRVAESQIDVKGNAALREIAQLLLTVAERYALGRVGALLDAEELVNVEPARNREFVRVIAFIALSFAGVVGVASLSLPSAVEGYAISAIGLLVLVLVYGSNYLGRLDILR